MSNEQPASAGSQNGFRATRREVYEQADAVWTRGEGHAPAIAKHRKQALKSSRGRIAIVDGCRTPFVKAG